MTGRQRTTLGRIASLAGSARVAAVLIVALASLAVLSVLIPQRSYMPADQMESFRQSAPALVDALDRIGLTSVFSSWIVVVLAAMLAVNVSVCTIQRVIRHARRSHGIDGPLGEGRVAHIERRLAEDGWRVLAADDDRIAAAKGRSGFFGSVVLHVGLLVIMIGGGLSALSSFRGSIVITEGQTIVDAAESYVERGEEPKLGEAYTGALIRLDSMVVGYENGEQVFVQARMSAQAPSGKAIERDVGVNHPLEVAGTAYLLQDSGLAPVLVLTTPDGASQEQAVNLAVETERGWSDSLALPELRVGAGPATLEMLASPVPLAEGKVLPAEKLVLRDPRLTVFVYDSVGPIYTGVLTPGATAQLTESAALTFTDVVLWNQYMVRRAPARWIVYVGFWMAVAGFAWRMVVPERRIAITLAEDGARVSYRVRPLPMRSYAEDERLVESLRTESSE